MSESERFDVFISSDNGTVFASKFARIVAIIDVASAEGRKKYVSGKRYPSYDFPAERISSPDINGKALAICIAISRTVVPSGKVIFTKGRPYAPVTSR